MADEWTQQQPTPAENNDRGYVPALRGSVGETHTVQDITGESIQISVDPSNPDPPRISEFDQLNDSRRITLGNLAREEATLRGTFRGSTAEFNKLRQSAERGGGILPEGTLDPVRQAELRSQADRLVRRDFERQGANIRETIGSATTREMRAQMDVLRRMGVPLPSKSEMTALANQATNTVMNDPFPGTDKSLNDRLTREAGRARGRYEQYINAQSNKERARAMDHLRRGLHDPMPGRTRVDGGSVGKALARIQRTEQRRALQEANTELARKVGFEFMYYKLSPNHRWYGGGEVCEVLAVTTGPGVVDRLRQLGADPGQVDLQGLFLRDQFPQVPHPNCMCMQEIWHPAEALEDNYLDNLVERGQIPDEIMNISDVTDLDVANMNRLAVELGFPPHAFDSKMVRALGVDGTAGLLAASIHPNAVRKAHHRTLALQETLAPRVAEHLHQAAARRDQLIAHLENNPTLSRSTVASESAKIHASFQSELQQANSIINTVQALERHLANPRRGINTAKTGDARVVLQELRDLGMPPSRDNYRIVRDSGRFSAEIPDEVLREYWRLRRQRGNANQRAEEIKAERNLRTDIGGVRSTGAFYGWRDGKPAKFDFKLDGLTPGSMPQHAGLNFIDTINDAQAGGDGRLLHFGAGLGKTPTVVASIADLNSQGRVRAGCIGVPAPLRTQMAQEIMAFTPEGDVVVYVSEGKVNGTRRVVQQGVRDTVLGGVPNYREYTTRSGRTKRFYDSYEDAIASGETWTEATYKRYERTARRVPDRSVVGDDYANELEAEITKRQARVQVKGMPKDAAGQEASFAEDRRRGVLYTVMGHDDLATSAGRAKNTFDYMAIDEIHQMTSQSTAAGSFKADQLQELTGGSIRFRVGLTGTAAKNTIGEFWDISNWLRPGALPPKAEFTSQYEGLTMDSDITNATQVAILRQAIAEYTYTRKSPLDVRLNNAFRDAHPDGTVRSQEEKDQYLRRVTMTDRQSRNAAAIEEEYERYKALSQNFRGPDRARLQERLRTNRDALQVEVDRHGINVEEMPVGNRRAMRRMLSDQDRFPSLSNAADRRRVMDLLTGVQEDSRTLNPEGWRDNQHHMNLHGIPRRLPGDPDQRKPSWRDNAKILETMDIAFRPAEDGGLGVGSETSRRPIIHVVNIESLEALTRAFQDQGIQVAQYHGSMNDRERAEVKRSFNAGAQGDPEVLIVTRAGSTGLNLQQQSSSTIHFDVPWTYAEYEQREARNWRTKQTNAVDSYTLTHEDSFTDQRRISYMRNKATILAAIDELPPPADRDQMSRISDHANPLGILSTTRATHPLLSRSYAELSEGLGRQKADQILSDLNEQYNVDTGAARRDLNAPIGAHADRDTLE